MNIKTQSPEGIIYQFEDSIEGHKVIVDITYSTGEAGELEFEFAEVKEDENLTLTEDQIRTYNKVLECGREEDYVRELDLIYSQLGIAFLPNHYEFND